MSWSEEARMLAAVIVGATMAGLAAVAALIRLGMLAEEQDRRRRRGLPGHPTCRCLLLPEDVVDELATRDQDGEELTLDAFLRSLEPEPGDRLPPERPRRTAEDAMREHREMYGGG